MRKITYITNVRMPTEKAHGIQIAKMCEAFGDNGAELELVVPRRQDTDPESAYAFYALRHNFRITAVETIDLVKQVPWLGYWLQLVTFTISIFFIYAFASRKDTLIYTRELFIAAILKWMGFDVVFEAHRVLLKKGAFFGLLKGIPKIVTNSRGVADEFRANGFKDVLPLSNGIDLSEFAFKAAKADLRKELGLPLDIKIALYTGYLYKWKGIDTLMGAAGSLSKEGRNNFRLVILGGSAADIKTYSDLAAQNGSKSIDFIGHKDRRIIPKYLKAADVLLLPNSAVSEESIKYTSPIKLFEYMASGVPVVASDFPSIREVLNENNSVLVKSDDPAALIQGIRSILTDPQKAESLAVQAYKDVSLLTWDSRAKKILDFIGA